MVNVQACTVPLASKIDRRPGSTNFVKCLTRFVSPPTFAPRGPIRHGPQFMCARFRRTRHRAALRVWRSAAHSIDALLVGCLQAVIVYSALCRLAFAAGGYDRVRPAEFPSDRRGAHRAARNHAGLQRRFTLVCAGGRRPSIRQRRATCASERGPKSTGKVRAGSHTPQGTAPPAESVIKASESVSALLCWPRLALFETSTAGI